MRPRAWLDCASSGGAARAVLDATKRLSGGHSVRLPCRSLLYLLGYVLPWGKTSLRLRCRIERRGFRRVGTVPALRFRPNLSECRTLINPDIDRPLSSTQAMADLRALAAWYRHYAEAAGNPAIWASRVSTAEDLEREAADIENRLGWSNRSVQEMRAA
jgi:hypothetical protein